MKIQETPAAVAEMLIRRPAAEVFEAFIDPAITSKFWFTHSSGRLKTGGDVTWEWRMYGFSSPVKVRDIVKDERIEVEWNDPPSAVVWTFMPMFDGATFVSIRNSGFSGNADQQVDEAIGSTEGFALVLAGAKAWLEHGLTLGLIDDRFPKGLPAS
ncbi:MAG: SRPBCC domain-containing protein [Pseudaminobacter sp.]|nr:SRPBCC domain-containing protein [Pseudaminobacter sp.]